MNGTIVYYRTNLYAGVDKMFDILIVLTWMIGTLLATTFAAALGRRFGVEYPLAFMATLVVAASVLANKIVIFGPFFVPAGIIVASATFLMTDILSELWGKEVANRAVWIGFLAMISFSVAIEAAIHWPAAPFAMDRAEMFNGIIGQTPRIAIASIVAYFVSQHHDVWAFHFLKEKTNNRHLWLRNNASTIVSQLLDSVIFITIAFYGTMPIASMIWDMWLVKNRHCRIGYTVYLFGQALNYMAG